MLLAIDCGLAYGLQVELANASTASSCPKLENELIAFVMLNAYWRIPSSPL